VLRIISELRVAVLAGVVVAMGATAFAQSAPRPHVPLQKTIGASKSEVVRRGGGIYLFVEVAAPLFVPRRRNHDRFRRLLEVNGGVSLLWVKSAAPFNSRLPVNFRYAPFATGSRGAALCREGPTTDIGLIIRSTRRRGRIATAAR
jgi:hypothetical protein